MILVDYKDIEVRQEDMHVLGDVTFTVSAGEFVYLIGKVGSGKSSLIKTLYGEIDPVGQGPLSHAIVLDEDMLHIRRKNIPGLRRRLGVVFQDFQLLTDRNVFDNLKFVLRSTGWKEETEIRQRIFDVLTLVGMDTKGYKMPFELSGGEQQRICIARALLNSPELILADEPTGSLDIETGRQIIGILHKVRESGTAVIMITHNLQWLDEYPGRVLKCEERHLTDLSDGGKCLTEEQPQNE
ncbi:MAG: ATP-binding cassette domain-containing protein [Bacteroidaceae bacterium]|nr:ATP-binding cassette domain-containing protein [Bacteroidaceae bacterium]